MFTPSIYPITPCSSRKHITYRYIPTADVLKSEELGEYVSFGIRVMRVEETQIDLVSDISTELQAVQQLADLCTERELDPNHLSDVIEDFLNSENLTLD